MVGRLAVLCRSWVLIVGVGGAGVFCAWDRRSTQTVVAEAGGAFAMLVSTPTLSCRLHVYPFTTFIYRLVKCMNLSICQLYIKLSSHEENLVRIDVPAGAHFLPYQFRNLAIYRPDSSSSSMEFFFCSPRTWCEQSNVPICYFF